MKKFLVALFAILATVLLVMPAMALTVEVKDMSTSPISVQRGEVIPVEVIFAPTAAASDVTVRAELSYGHGKEILDVSKPVDVISGTTYVEKLSLAIPKDIEVMPPGEYYTLSIEVKDGKGTKLEQQEFRITVQRQNDLLEIQKVIKPSVVEAGKYAILKIVVKNIGSDKQEDVYLKITVPELGIVSEERVGDLEAVDRDDKQDAAAKDIAIKIPSDAASGTYTVNIKAYNINTIVESKDSLTVKDGIGKASDVVADATTKDITQGKGIVYEVKIVNLGTAEQSYAVSVSGTEGWATYSVNPSSVTVATDSSQKVNVYVAANEKATTGQHDFTVTVKSGDNVVKQLQLTANVKKAARIDTMLITVIVLAIILVVLIVIFVLKSKKPETAEEESYY